MKVRTILTRSFVLALLCAICFGGIAWLVGDKRISSFDSIVIRFVQGRESASLTAVMKFFSAIGTGLPVVLITLAIMAVLAFLLGQRKELYLFAGVVLGSALLNEALKQAFRRARPTLHRIAEANGYSFPSGHSMAAFSLYGITAFLLWKHARSSFRRVALIIGSVIFILAIGISRIYLGVHYPSDVVGGYLASGCWLACCMWFYQRSLEWRATNKE